MTVSDLLSYLSLAPDWAPIEIYTPDATATIPIERAMNTPRGAVVLVTREPQPEQPRELPGQLALFKGE